MKVEFGLYDIHIINSYVDNDGSDQKADLCIVDSTYVESLKSALAAVYYAREVGQYAAQ